MFKRILLIIVIITLLAASAMAAIKVYLDDKLISERATIINGSVYIPAADIAKRWSLSANYDKKSQVLKLATQGGAEQVTATEGKLGEWLFDGTVRLMLDSIEEKEEYGRKKLVATLTFKNGTDKAMHVWAREVYLSDAEGDTVTGSYVASFQLLPGAAKTTTTRIVADNDFEPAKLIVKVEVERKVSVFRVWLSDE
ncbi:MAG: hypothetical protein KKB81_06310 [Candidatus Margulisbacteria bacterium]|nr:hypothetical protein [Candidatus Margulisiibacteriota bacterium]MBU1021469.1 hypothetical protein [Candidatus Margulisiibacteriota bacterium]MBU1728390.1 hypothetical protein [Candidatus Margulisiibacteriota bacterium]MBU1955867.1 hypothetical protein [Candidatus Margulisiibacteriota bacterium]